MHQYIACTGTACAEIRMERTQLVKGENVNSPAPSDRKLLGLFNARAKPTIKKQKV